MSSFPSDFRDTVGDFNYQDEDVIRGLKSSGQIYVEIDPVTSGFKSEFFGTKIISKEMPVHNGRELNMTLDDNGFTMLPADFSNVDFTNEQDILQNYYPQVADFVKKSTGAFKVFCFDHVVRHTDVSLNYEKRGDVVVGGKKYQITLFLFLY